MTGKSDRTPDTVALKSDRLTAARDIVDDLREIDNLHDELFADYLVPPAEEIDNLYDELFPAGRDEKGESAAPAVLEGMDGREHFVLGAQPGQPGDDEITFHAEDGAGPYRAALAGFRCIRTPTRPDLFAADAACEIETIETGDGHRYDLFVPREQRLNSGIFAFSTRKNILGQETVDQYFFFPGCNTRQRCRKCYLGEILMEKGMIDGPELQRALDEQQQRRNRRLGQIIAEKAHIPQEAVEEEIRKAVLENKPARVGEILVAGGLVDEKLVQAALRAQEQLKKKIGELLIEKGRLGDEEVFRALAEKFRMAFVDLRRESFSGKALATMPREVAVKFQLLPIAFRNGSLVVATMVPDAPTVRNVIYKYTGRRDIQLVLARPAQLRKAIGQLYP